MLSPSRSLGTLPRVFYNQALQLARAEAFSASRDRLIAALSLEPDLVEARNLLGKVYARMGDYREAIACWEETLDSVPCDATARAGIAKARELKEKIEKGRARDIYRRIGFGAVLFALGMLSLQAYFVAYSRFFPPGKGVVEPIRTILGDTAALRETRLEVSAGEGGIRIAGSVETEDQKRLAGAIAEGKAEGLPVDVSAVAVRHPAPLAESFSGILKRIGAGEFDSVTVEQRQGVLVLSGAVSSIHDKRRIVSLGRALVGVRSVDTRGLMIRGAEDYTVRIGDTLWDLAARFYADGKEWVAIAEFNPQLSPPYRSLRVGTPLKVPPLKARSRLPTAKEEGVLVK